MLHKVTFPNMGNYSIAFKVCAKAFGFDEVISPKTDKEAVELGCKLSPEFVCFPFKVNIGNYVGAIKKGAEAIAMWDTGGECRFRYYGMLQEKILKDAGYNIPFYTLTAKSLAKELLLSKYASVLKKAKIAVVFLQKVGLIELIENLSWYFRPRELKERSTGLVMSKCLNLVDRTNSSKKLWQLRNKIKREFNNVEIDKKIKPLKIGIVGEIYVIAESYVHRDMDVALGNLGAEIHKATRLSTVMKHFLNPLLKKFFYRQAYPYLGTSVGGHGQDSVAHMLEYAKEGFDGIIHLAPFGCMPETTVRPILNQISKEKNLPLLSLTLDEQSAEAGIQTRLEAFVDLIKDRKIKN